MKLIRGTTGDFKEWSFGFEPSALEEMVRSTVAEAFKNSIDDMKPHASWSSDGIVVEVTYGDDGNPTMWAVTLEDMTRYLDYFWDKSEEGRQKALAVADMLDAHAKWIRGKVAAE